MQKTPNWPFHVVVWNMTASETEMHAEEFENAIKSHLLPLTISAFENELVVSETTDILFSFPTEQGLTPRSDVPILVHIRCRIPNTLTTLKKSNLEIELELTRLVSAWPNREAAGVFLDITS